jgi:hypothetical protein
MGRVMSLGNIYDLTLAIAWQEKVSLYWTINYRVMSLGQIYDLNLIIVW